MRDPDATTRVDVRLKRAFEGGTLPRELLVIGPAGTGKTFSILCFLHLLAADHPNLRILIVRQTRASLTESICVTYEQEILPLDGMGDVASGMARRNRSSYRYPNGSEIVLGGMDSPTRIASTAWDFAFVNESIELAEDGWETVGSRLNRPGRPTWAGYLIGDTNPGDPAHWLKARVDNGVTPAWETAHEANPGLHDGLDWTESGRLYMARLDRLRGTRRKRLRDGLWAAGEGQWFAAFDPDKHVDASAAFDPRHPVHLAVDTGVHTGAVWFQVRDEWDGPKVTVFGDYYSYDVPAFDNARAILGKTEALCKRFDVGRFDPSGNASSGFGGTTIASEYQRAGLRLTPWPKYPGCVAAGLALVESFVSVEPAKLLVHPDCTALTDALTNYKRKKRGGQYVDEPEDPQHPYEEVVDALRSGLLDKWPEGRKPEPVLIRKPGRRVF
jgi:hypothetical protein